MPGMVLIIIGAMGLAFGSFITLASWRLPRDEDVVRETSRCPVCRTKLKARDLVPVLSWLWTRGKCRFCGVKIHWRYPLIELITAALFLWLLLTYGLTPQAAILALAGVALMVLVVADLEHYIIPDQVHLALLPLGAAYRFYFHPDWADALGGMALGLFLGLSLRYGYRLLRKKEGLGLGDVKFLAVAGLWLGVTPLVPFLFLSGLFGVVLALLWRAAGRGRVFPFGPALAAAMFLCVAVPEVPQAFWDLQWRMYQ